MYSWCYWPLWCKRTHLLNNKHRTVLYFECFILQIVFINYKHNRSGWSKLKSWVMATWTFALGMMKHCATTAFLWCELRLKMKWAKTLSNLAFQTQAQWPHSTADFLHLRENGGGSVRKHNTSIKQTKLNSKQQAIGDTAMLQDK